MRVASKLFKSALLALFALFVLAEIASNGVFHLLNIVFVGAACGVIIALFWFAFKNIWTPTPGAPREPVLPVLKTVSGAVFREIMRGIGGVSR